MIQPVQDISQQLAAMRGQRPTMIEGSSTRIAKVVANIATSMGKTKMAMERGKMLAEHMKPILKRQVELKINIHHAHGTVRCNAYLDREMAEVERLEALQLKTMIDLNLMPALIDVN